MLIRENRRRTPLSERKIMEDKRKINRKQTGKAEDKKRGQQEKVQAVRREGSNKGAHKRAKGLCPMVEKCGGCQLLHYTYEDQLRQKQKRLEKLLGEFGKVEPVIGMKEPLHYRNKVHAAFGRDRKGNIISGTYAAGTHRIVPVETCLLEDKKADEIIGTIRGMLKSFRIKTYDEDTGYGLLRHVLIRIGKESGQIMVVLVLGSPILPSKNNFVRELRRVHPEITTVVLNINDKKTSMVLGDRNITLYGPGYIEDSLCGKIFRISPKSFYQVNPSQTEVLYRTAIDFAGLTGKERILDAYCGIGTIGIIASGGAKEVMGVEMNPDAVKDAVINAKRNEVQNIRFYQADAGELIRDMAEQKEKLDVVFMDPPRSGSTEIFMDSVAGLAPKKVVYVSCEPETLRRDLLYFKKLGFRVQRMAAVDMFPMTENVEVVIRMTYCSDKEKIQG